MILLHMCLRYETVNVHLFEKPDWFIERSPVGNVPVLECNDKVTHFCSFYTYLIDLSSQMSDEVEIK